MNSKSDKISHQQLLSEAKEELKTVGTYVQCVTITEQNWKALISELNTQVKVLQDIEERLKMLATRQQLTDTMRSHLEMLINHAQSMKTEISQFNSHLQKPVSEMKSSLESMLTDTEKQVGKMSEQFSQALSQEKQRLRKHTTKLMLISLIPSVILIVWELIRHFFLAT